MDLAWQKVRRPVDLGGLGLPDLTLQGFVLRIRWLWLKRTDPNRPWSRLPEGSDNTIEAMFAASLSVEVGNGLNSFFWTDKWIDGHSIADLDPALLNAVRPHARKVRTVAQGLFNNTWGLDITGALTVQVILDYLLIWDIIRQRQQPLNLNAPDIFRWKWTADGQFTTASAYKAFF